MEQTPQPPSDNGTPEPQPSIIAVGPQGDATPVQPLPPPQPVVPLPVGPRPRRRRPRVRTGRSFSPTKSPPTNSITVTDTRSFF